MTLFHAVSHRVKWLTNPQFHLEIIQRTVVSEEIKGRASGAGGYFGLVNNFITFRRKGVELTYFSSYVFANTGTATLTNVTATDPLPPHVTYVPGSLTSGPSCAAATTAEDDDATGADEGDPFGAGISGTTIGAAAATLTGGASFAIKFKTTIQ